MPADALTVTVGYLEREHIVIAVLGWMNPGSTDRWDGNWLNALLTVRLGRFTAAIPAGLRSTELRIFREQLDVLNECLEGSATLSSLEGWVHIDVVAGSGGHLEVSGEVTDDPSMGNRLRFRIEGLDQTYLGQMISELAAIEHAYPEFTDQ